MAEENGHSLQRSSSQASNVSSQSSKVRTIRIRPKKSLSNTAATPGSQEDPSLTSFPSLSPENSSKFPSRSDAPAGSTQLEPARTVSQRLRDRKATLAGLTNASPSLKPRTSLFDDSPRPSLDIPGALHLATDDHIERLISKTGAVKLVRQFAQDLAHRDAELSALRIRADEREREMKKMLREVQVSSFDVELRLRQLENASTGYVAQTNRGADGRPGLKKRITNSIDDMMHQAMQEEVGLSEDEFALEERHLDFATSTPRSKPDHDEASSIISMKKRPGSVRSWGDYIWGSGGTSRKTSRSSSINSADVPDDPDATAKARAPSTNAGRRKGLDNLFTPQPPSGTSYFIGGTVKKPPRKPLQPDTASINSKKSERSISSWTVKLFAGIPNASREGDSTVGRARSSSLDRPGNMASTRILAGSTLSKVNSNPGPVPSRSSIVTRKNTPPLKKAYPSNVSLSTIPDFAKPDSTVSNLGPVEMDAILPEETKPPTMNNTYTYNNFVPGNMLTDRFGFIYDQRQRKRQREAAMAVKRANRKSGTESLRSLQIAMDGDIGANKTQERKSSGSLLPHWARPGTPTSLDEQQLEAGTTKSWQDYLRISTRPTELLSHTPSAGAIVTLTVADSAASPVDHRSRRSSLSIEPKVEGLPPITTQNAEPAPSTVFATNAEFVGGSDTPDISATPTQAPDQEPVKLLLEQLTELHDKLQAERAVKWNEFLRKVRAERGAAVAAASDRLNNKGTKMSNMPEASLLDGEVIGVSDLGNKGKIGRAKWKEFKMLVLGGIPVSLRPKIWSECSGASALRIPGYYDDLVVASSSRQQTEEDIEVAGQIQADIHRTLTDNVFFRHGPGTTKLREVLLAYARRNPTVGYCQGMNMIAGSLLLIMPTAEDAFWILVAMIENILPAHYYDHGLVTSRADQIVLREYVSEILPRLSTHLEELNVELEAMTFQWFLSVFTDCLSAEALYRVWDVVLCLNSTSAASPTSPIQATSTSSIATATITSDGLPSITNINRENEADNAGTGSTFLFQLALALLKLNEAQLLTCDNPASIYGYINHNMTNHAISIDGLIQASEGLRKVVLREDVLERRGKAIEGMGM